MTARAYRTEGYWRAVCKADECRDDNAQRNYWRTPFLSQGSAERAAAEHNRDRHPAAAGGKP